MDPLQLSLIDVFLLKRLLIKNLGRAVHVQGKATLQINALTVASRVGEQESDAKREMVNHARGVER